MTEAIQKSRCGKFCIKQAMCCWKLARLNISPEHCSTFMRMASDWKRFALMCAGRQHLCIESSGRTSSRRNARTQDI